MNTPYSGKKIAILGFGVEGSATLKYLVKHGATVWVFDEKKEDEFDIKQEKQGVPFHFGPIPDLSSFDFVVRSPGIKLTHPALKSAKHVTSATKIFFDLCPGKIIGVTGTKGKGTTSTLIYEMLLKQGYSAFLGGNIGTPPLSFLDQVTSDSWIVLELSSFQLQDLTKSPHIAVMLMITSEHLAADKWGTKNYHETLEEYIEAKRNIVRFQTVEDMAILNRDYPASNESDVHTLATIYNTSIAQGVLEDGCFIKDGIIMLKMNGKEESIMKIVDILLPGRHNLENVTAAVMAATLAGVDKKNIVDVLKTFKGLEHRIELVLTIQGVRYYDDSFSTTPETAIAAIEAFDAPEILILGGSTKGSDFSELGRIISESDNIKAIIGVGQEWSKIKSRIQNSKFRIIEEAKNMKEIVEAAAKVATLGDVVLLSPACASFDMFKNYKDRGNQFKEEVLKLKENTSS